MSKRKILLLNPPFPSGLSRDYSCPHTYKIDYAWPAIDLVIISGILSDQDLSYMDAVREQIDENTVIAAIVAQRPSFIFIMVSSISEKIDFEFIGVLRKSTSAKIAILGDIVSFDFERHISRPEIDFLIRDFTNADHIRQAALGHRDEKLINFAQNHAFSIGVPRHELFLKHDYYYPYSLHNHVAPVLTSYGCPYKCTYCNSGKLGFKTRNQDEIIEELSALKKLGIREIIFKDFTFFGDSNRSLLEYMIRNRLGLVFSCSSRVDTVDADILHLLKAAGCFLLFFGIESEPQALNKGFTRAQILQSMREAKRFGIETLTSFIIGFPDETLADIRETERLISEVDPDYISINVLVARIGSDIRQAIHPSLHQELDCSSSKGVLTLGNKSMDSLRSSIELRFYFNPLRLPRFFRLALKSPFRAKNTFKNIWAMIRRTF